MTWNHGQSVTRCDSLRSSEYVIRYELMEAWAWKYLGVLKNPASRIDGTNFKYICRGADSNGNKTPAEQNHATCFQECRNLNAWRRAQNRLLRSESSAAWSQTGNQSEDLMLKLRSVSISKTYLVNFFLMTHPDAILKFCRADTFAFFRTSCTVGFNCPNSPLAWIACAIQDSGWVGQLSLKYSLCCRPEMKTTA